MYRLFTSHLLPKIFNRDTENEKRVGFTASNSVEDIISLNILKLNKGKIEIFPGIHTSGEMPKKSQYEKLSGMLLSVEKYKNDKYENDNICEDMPLIIELGTDNIVIITGCCHSGLVNTIIHVQEEFPNKKIIGIIGGLQLHVAEKDQLEDTLSALKELPLTHFYPLHSSGEIGINFFSEKLESKTSIGGVGSIIQFSV